VSESVGPEEQLEVVRRALDAWNRRDLDGALAQLHDDCELDWSQSRGPQRGIYRGIEQIRSFYEEWLSIFDEVDIRAAEFIESQSNVVVPNRGRARGREGVTVEATSTQVFTLRGAKIARIRLYQDKASALADVGISGQA
jgi:ketosteroid isomerase-like protein